MGQFRGKRRQLISWGHLETEENGSIWLSGGHDARRISRHSKTMPVYGAESRTPNHTQFRDNKTAGERLALFRKKLVWSACANLAP